MQVLRWQVKQRKQAQEQGFVLTMLGRRRNLPDAQQRGNSPQKYSPLRSCNIVAVYLLCYMCYLVCMLCVYKCEMLYSIIIKRG